MAGITAGGKDITEGVQALYDMVVQSMDFASGFLTVEDLLPVLDAAEAAGFDLAPLERYMVGDAVKKRLELWVGGHPAPAVGSDGHPAWVERWAEARAVFEAEEIAAFRGGRRG